MHQAYKMYQKQSIEGAPREDIMLRLMGGAVSTLGQARACWKNGQDGRARELRSRAYDIISELDSSLDRENGPQDIVEGLEGLYAFMEREITASAPKDDFDRLEPVQQVCETIYRGFSDAVAEYKKSAKNEKGSDDSSRIILQEGSPQVANAAV